MISIILIIVLFVLICICFSSIATLRVQVNSLRRELAGRGAAAVKPEATVAAETAIKAEIVKPQIKASVQVPTEKPARETAQTQTPVAPSAVELWFKKGNWIARIGMLLLFIGAAFLIKAAADAGFFPVSLRLGGVFVIGMALFGLAFYLKKHNLQYAILLAGGGFAITYLTTLAALSYFHLIGAGLSFVILTLLLCASVYAALSFNAISLMAISLIGGFLSPSLIGASGGMMSGVLIYYLLLNIGTLFVTYHKRWPLLIWLAFIATYLCAPFWHHHAVQSSPLLLSFLVVFFLIYVIATLLINLRSVTLVFSNPIVSVGLLGHVIGSYSNTTFSYWILGLCIFYFAMSRVLQKQQNFALLRMVFAFIGSLLLSIFVLLHFKLNVVLFIWALEGAMLCYLGCRMKRRAYFILGVLLQLGTAGLLSLGWQVESWFSIANNHLTQLDHLLTVSVLMLAGFFSAWLAARYRRFHAWEAILLAWSLVWWLATGYQLIHLFVPSAYVMAAGIEYVIISCAVFWLLFDACHWQKFIHTRYLLGAVLYLQFMLQVTQNMTVTSCIVIWLTGFALWVAIAYRHHCRRLALPKKLKRVIITLVGLAIAYTLTQDLWPTSIQAHISAWQVMQSRSAIIILAYVLLLCRYMTCATWPFKTVLKDTLRPAVVLSALCVVILLCTNLINPGVIDFKHYWVALNSSDIASGLLLVCIWRLSKHVTLLPEKSQPVYLKTCLGTGAVFAFIWLNSMIVCIFHYYVGIQYGHMIAAQNLQTTLSITWSVVAFLLMRYSHRHAVRGTWYVGVALLAIAVFKMLFVDLAYQTTLLKVLVFIVVGIIFLLIGYFYPIPEKKAASIGTSKLKTEPRTT